MKRIACLPCLVAGIAALGVATAAPIGAASLPPMGQPGWSPKTNVIAFVLGDRIALIRPNGSGLRRIGSPTLAEAAPSWSSSGQLAFVRQRSVAGTTGSELVVADPHGRRQRVLPIPAAVTQPESFAWSKDGQRVRWVVPRGSSVFAAIVSLDVRSGAVTSHAQPTRCVLPAAQQPGGTLSVCVQAESPPPRLTLLRHGKRLGFIGRLSGTSSSQPAWSPFGSRLAYAIDRQHVAVLTFAAGMTRTFAIPMRAPAGEEGTATVSWSPDGFHLVVGSNQAAGWKIVVIDLRNGKLTTLAAHA